MSISATSRNNLAIFKVLLAGILFGTAGTIATYAPDSASPTSLGISRLFFGAAFLIIILPRIGGDRKKLLSLIKHPLVWVMALFSASYQPLFFGATQRSGVALSTLITVGSIPIFTGLVGRIFLKEPIKISWVAATCLAIFGLIIRSWGKIEFNNLLGLFMALGAGLSVSFYLNSAKVELRKGDHSMELPAVAYLLGSLMLIPLLAGENIAWIMQPKGLFVGIFLGVVTMAIANALQISGLGHLPPGPTATLMLADPFTATILGVLILGEPFGILPAIGLGLVGLALVLQSYLQTRAKS